MKTNVVKRDVQSTASEAKGFEIKADSKAFQVLRDSLYTDKPLAIVRETFTNAYDAHLSVGKENEPFEVILPTMWESTFSVRDFGPGMSHEFMMGNYSVAFHSEKDHNNDQVGGFGLGRMSAFSYTDNYSVITRIKGKKRYYSLIINEDSIPEVNFLGEEETTEPDGTEVTFPISSHDTKKFSEAMKKVSFGFDVKPLVKGDPDFEWPAQSLITEGKNFKVYEAVGWDQSSLGHGVYAKMGCVVYPIDQSVVGDKLIGKYSSRAVVLNFPIGSLAVVASREALSYGRKEPTVSSIKRMFDVVRREIAESMKKSFDELSSFGEAFWGRTKVKETFHAFDLGDTKLTWQGEEVPMYFNVPRRLGVAFSSYSRGNAKYVDYRSSNELSKLMDHHRPAVVYVSDETEKRPIRRKERITKHVEDNTYSSAKKWVIVVTEKNLRDFEWFVGRFPDENYILVNDLPDPGPATKEKRGPVKAKILLNSWGEWTTSVEISPEAFDKGGYYIPSYQNNPDGFIQVKETKYGHLGWRELNSVIWPSFQKHKNITDQPHLYVIPRPLRKKFEEADQWIDLIEHLSQTFSIKEDQRIKRLVCGSQKLMLADFCSRLGKIRDYAQSVNQTPLDTIYLEVAFIYDQKEKMKGRIETLNQKLYNKYPLLRHYCKDDHEHFENYVKLMDMKGKVDV